MENKISSKSFIETFINEFSGIPGISIKVLSPFSFQLVDEKQTLPLTRESKACSIISVVKVDPKIGYQQDQWDFKYLKLNYSSLPTFETFYSIKLSDLLDEKYQENDMLINMLKAYYDLYASYSIASDAKTETAFNRFIPTEAYINAGVSMGILLCGERRLETDCHYHSTKNTNPTIFTVNMVANGILKKIDSLEKRNQELLEALSSIHQDQIAKTENRTAPPKFDMAGVGELVKKNTPIKVDNISRFIENVISAFENDPTLEAN